MTNFEKNVPVLNDKSIDKELFIHIISCLTLTIIIKVYLAEEDQHELYKTIK